MLVIVFGLIVLGTVIAEEDGPSGYMFSSANVINLDMNEKSYTVGCSLNETTKDLDSRNLTITTLTKSPLETKVINNTTIVHEVDLRVSDESTICGEKEYACRFNRTSIGMKTIYIARPLPKIKPSDFKCISHNRDVLTCEFKRQDSCDFNVKYTLYMISISSGLPSGCDLTEYGSTLRFNSTSKSCVYMTGHRNIPFLIVGENIMGKTETRIDVDHYDIVRPAAPTNLEVSFVNSTSVEGTWSMSIRLLNLDRVIEFEFLMISKYESSTSFKNMTFQKDVPMVHQFSGLHAFTKYELKIRARVVPRSVRKFEEEYWSDWSSVGVHTKACRPYQAPRTAQGAYSFKERRDKLATVEVYWELVPEYLHNGPGFGYEVFAVSNSGRRLNASTSVHPNGVATFRNIKTDERYTVHLFSHNEEGRSENDSIIHIFPAQNEYVPKIKRVLQLNDSYHLQWFSFGTLERLSNYTVMHCTFGATGSCQNSIEIVTLPPNATSYSIHSAKTPNFALAANFKFYSSELSWMQCIVDATRNINQLTYSFTEITEHSVTLRLSLFCMDQSLIERFEVRYWPKMNEHLKKNITKRSYVTAMTIDGLEKDTEYVVELKAYDENDILYKDSQTVRTSDNDILLQVTLFLLFGLLVMAIVAKTAARRMKEMMNINVEIPLRLEEILEMPENSSQSKTMQTVWFSKLLETDELLPLIAIDQDNSDDAEQSDLAQSILHQPDEVVRDEQACLSEQSEEQLPYDLDDKAQPVILKSILEKPDEAVHDKYVCLPEQLEKEKPTVQVVTASDYIQPSHMKVKPDLSGNRLSCSSGYVDVNLMIKQQSDR